MNREQVREAVGEYMGPAVMAFHRGEDDVFAHYRDRIIDAIVKLDKPVTVAFSEILRHIAEAPQTYAGFSNHQKANAVRKYLTAQGVNVEDE